MIISNNKKYTYDDISIIPSRISYIKSRSECNPYDKNGKLPIFVAPMSSIIDESNFDIFNKYVNAILPRNIDFSIRLAYICSGKWTALSLQEFIDLFINNTNGIISKDKNFSYKILIDIANGHMAYLLKCIKDAKNNYPNLIIMAGNIARPGTIISYSSVGVNFARIGIGSGEGCITSSNTGIHYPMASLINDIVTDKCGLDIKIIADGGIRNYDHVIKALALGADYVMIGGLFAQFEEACGKIITIDGKKYHKFYGMASKQGQIDLSGKKVKTSEGVCKNIEIKYTLEQWCDNMASYLKSAMSYCNSTNLDDFRLNTDCIIISNNSKLSINK